MSKQSTQFQQSSRFKWKSIWYTCLVCRRCFQFEKGLINHKIDSGCGRRYPTLAERGISSPLRQSRKRKNDEDMLISNRVESSAPTTPTEIEVIDISDDEDRIPCGSRNEVDYQLNQKLQSLPDCKPWVPYNCAKNREERCLEWVLALGAVKIEAEELDENGYPISLSK